MCAGSLSDSNDYPGAAQRRIEDGIKEGVAFFLQGFGGNIKPRLIAGERFISGDIEDVHRFRYTLGDEVLRVLNSPMQKLELEIKARICEVQLPMEKIPSRDELERGPGAQPFPKGVGDILIETR